MRTVEEIVGQNIRRLRERMNFSREELGRLAGNISSNTILRWELARQAWRVSNLDAISKILGCRTIDFFKEQGIKEHESLSLEEAITLLNIWKSLRPSRRETLKRTLLKSKPHKANVNSV